MNLKNRKRLLDLENKFMVAGGRGRDGQGFGDGHVHIAIFETDIQQRPAVYHMELCSMLFGNPDERQFEGK